MTNRDTTPYVFVSGAGNDFIALLDQPAPVEDVIAAWCRRGVSVGADGLFTLRRRAPERFVLDYANADGARAALCLNAARCAARLAFEQAPGASRVTIDTGAGALDVEPVDETRTSVLVPRPSTGAERPTTLPVDGKAIRGYRIEVGVPHFVLWWPEDLENAPLRTLGPLLRAHADLGTEGANVHFVRLEPPRRLSIRSFERGVEAETLACGTGVVAAVACAVAERQLELPVEARTRSGFELRVDDADPHQNAGPRWRLSGDARIVARGHLESAAAVTLRP